MVHEVVIVGGGINGLMIALNLVLRGLSRILVIDEGYIGSGSTYRCATGIRASFTSKEHVMLMKRSIELWSKLSNELGFRYERSGYLWLITNEEDLKFFKNISRFHNSLDIPTRVIDRDFIKQLVPGINMKEIISGLYDPLAGKADCFETVLSVFIELKKLGVKIQQYNKVLKIKYDSSSNLFTLSTREGVLRSNYVVVAAGYGTKKLLSNLGIEVPLRNVPKHALITERFKEVFKPLIIDWSTSSYIVQTFHGGFIMGTELAEEGEELSVRIDFLFKALNIWRRYLPWIRYLNVLRYWTGYYVMSPDHHPILGPIEGFEGLYVASGFSGHGFMMAPVVGEVISDWIVRGKPSLREAESLTLNRFKEGKYIKEIAVVG